MVGALGRLGRPTEMAALGDGDFGSEAGEEHARPDEAMRDRPTAKDTAYTFVVADAIEVFKERKLALLRGSKPAAAVVLQRLRKNGFLTPLWGPMQTARTSGEAQEMPLFSAMCALFEPGSYGATWVSRAGANNRTLAVSVFDDRLNFPEVPKPSGEYCYENGVFDLYTRTFTPYEAYEPGDASCSMVYFPIDFDEAWLAPGAPLSAPAFESIVNLQDWTPTERELCEAMLGRLAFPLNMFDRWQTAPFLTGVGGSGKTTLTDAIVRAAYGPSQIGFISNTIEKNFPFEALRSASVVVAADIDKDLMLNLSQTDLHKMINGEELEINVKHGARVTVKWSAPLLLVANVVPDWQDDQGQMSRRLVYFDFSRVPVTVDTTLAARLREPREATMILLKLTRTYMAVTQRYGALNMDAIVRTHFPRLRSIISRVQRESKPISHFIEECVSHTPGYYVPMRTLQEVKTRFCETYGYDAKLVQFRKEFQNLCAARGMKYYSGSEYQQSDAYRARAGTGQAPGGACLDHASISLQASLMQRT